MNIQILEGQSLHLLNNGIFSMVIDREVAILGTLASLFRRYCSSRQPYK